MISVDVTGIAETQAKIAQVIVDLYGADMLNAMRQGTALISAEAKIAAAVDTGRLRASITPEVTLDGSNVVGIVGSNVKYAADVELGSDPHWARLSDIELWAARKGLDKGVARAIQVAIGLKGTQAQPYLFPAFETHQQTVVGLIESAVEKIVNK